MIRVYAADGDLTVPACWVEWTFAGRRYRRERDGGVSMETPGGWRSVPYLYWTRDHETTIEQSTLAV